MRRFNLRLWSTFAAVFAAGVVAACTSPTSTTVPPPPANCTTCVTLSGSPQTVQLDSVDGLAIRAIVAGSGTVFINDSGSPFSSSGIAALLAPNANLGGSLFYVRFTAYNGSATLTRVPGLQLTFPGVIDPGPTFRMAALLNGAWTTVGKPGIVRGRSVLFKPENVSPPIRLASGNSYEVGVYAGGILPPTPSPSPSPTHSPSPSPSPSVSPSPTPSPKPSSSPTPTPGALTVTITCNTPADACTNGSATAPGSVQFTAIGDTATLTPNETPASTYTLKSDTCNKADDASARGNWATISPAAGQTGTTFTVTAQNGGTATNLAQCAAIFGDTKGQTVTVNIEVTLGSIGVH